MSAYAFIVACGTSHPFAEGNGTFAGNDVRQGPCTVDGERASCHVETGRNGNIINCFSGTQVCKDGKWGVCGDGTSGTLSTVDLSLIDPESSGSILHPNTTVTIGADAGGCLTNPCNPYCLGIDVDAGLGEAGITPDGGIVTVTGSVLATDQPYTSFPGGAQNANAVPACSRNVPAEPDGGYLECSYDYCCGSPDGGGSTGQCIQSIKESGPVDAGGSGGDAGFCNHCTGKADFTSPVGCKDTNGVIHVPVCNRGIQPANAGTLMLAEYSANPGTSGTPGICGPPGGSYGGHCRIDLAAKPIAPGICLDINPALPGPGITCTSTTLWNNGNRSVWVNPTSGTYSGFAYTQLTSECDTCNNESFVFVQNGTGCVPYGSSPPPPATVFFTYTALCLPGYKAQWNQFAYNATVPLESEVVFNVSSAPALADGGPGAFSAPVQIAKDHNPGGPDPAICPMSGPSPCPKDLATALGANSYNPILKISMTLTSVTAVPSVQGWQATYNCVPNE